jgi:hypothetical protein
MCTLVLIFLVANEREDLDQMVADGKTAQYKTGNNL